MDDDAEEYGQGHAAGEESYGASQGESESYDGASQGMGDGDDGSSVAGSGTWHALCNTMAHGTTGWFGPDRPTEAEAQSDADAHNAAHPGHVAAVSYGSFP